MEVCALARSARLQQDTEELEKTEGPVQAPFMHVVHMDTIQEGAHTHTTKWINLTHGDGIKPMQLWGHEYMVQFEESVFFKTSVIKLLYLGVQF